MHDQGLLLLYLWDKRTFYLSHFDQPLQLSQAAGMLMIGLDGPFKLFNEMGEVHCRSALAPAGARFGADSCGSRIAMCFLDVFGADWRRLQPRFARQLGGLGLDLDDEREWVERFRSLRGEAAEPVQVWQWLEQLINPLGLPWDEQPCDPRIMHAVRLIKGDVANNPSIGSLAREVALSVPRLTQLFRQDIGIPIRRYRLWHRLFVTSIGVAQGLSLTDAAMAAGFTDSAHFNHTFRAILGMTPSAVLARSRGVRLFAEGLGAGRF